jgi:hypothetical protein
VQERQKDSRFLQIAVKRRLVLVFFELQLVNRKWQRLRVRKFRNLKK